MKFYFSILLCFIFYPIYSQVKIENLTSIELYKPYYRTTDGNCNPFLDRESANIVSKKIIDRDDLVLRLIEIQEKKKEWKNQESTCVKGWIGGSDIENMVVYQFNKLIDTLYFSNYETRTILFDYKNKIDYFDNKNEIINVLFKSTDLKKFYLTNVDSIFYKTIQFRIDDSISIDNVKINGKNYYNLKKEKLDSLVGGFSRHVEIERDVIDKKDKYMYYNSNKDSYNHYYFINDYPISGLSVLPIAEEGNQYADEEVFNINGITFNDSEEKLIQLFPNSTQYIKEIKEFFKAENGDYSIDLKISDQKGNIVFLLNNGKIIKIEVDFYYPKVK